MGKDSGDTKDDLASLRSILLGPAERQLQALEARIDDRFARAHDVGAVLPQAFLQRARDPELARALSPPIEQAITASVRRNPKPLADAIFPVIGPAIRKAVAASLASMVESLNRTLESSCSWRALKWRVEAIRTGRPFGEILLLNTLLYRVEQVFLIHRTTGLLLQHVRAGAARVEDAQMVSAMLTAIRDFVQDSFRVSEQDSLDALQMGELSVWIEQGPHAILAAVMRGNAPQDRRRLLQDTLESIHLQCGEALLSFNGDASPFESSRAALEDCLQTGTGRRRGRARVVQAIIVGLAVVALALWAGFSLRERGRWARYLEALRSEPGFVVIADGRRDGKRFVAGLRDPLARDPQDILRQAQLSPSEVVGNWEPYQALAPTFVLARARAILQPPPGATLTLRDGVLSATGQAPAAWVSEARRMTPLIAGVTHFETAGLLESDIQSLKEQLESAVLLFVQGTAQPVAGQDEDLRLLGQHVHEFDAAAASAGRFFRIDVVGYSDTDGAAESNLPLSRARAQTILASLALQSSPHVTMQVVGMGSSEPVATGNSEADKQRNRRVVTARVRNGAGLGPMIQKKVCMLGAFAVGKTSLVSRFVTSMFSDKYLTTVGVKIDKKALTVGDREVTLMLWDIHGQDEFQTVKQSYLRGSAGCLLVIDGTRRGTLDIAASLQLMAERVAGSIPFVIVLNKADLASEWQVDERGLKKLAEQGWPVVRTSAKTGEGVEDTFVKLTRAMLDG